jgi:hypothetical protein
VPDAFGTIKAVASWSAGFPHRNPIDEARDEVIVSEYSEQIAAGLARGAQIVVENRALAEAVGDPDEARELREQADTLERMTSRRR